MDVVRRAMYSYDEFRDAVHYGTTVTPTWSLLETTTYMSEVNRNGPPTTGQQIARETPSQLLNRLLSRGEYP